MDTTQAERNLRKSPPANPFGRLWFATFFATGGAIGLFIATRLSNQGVSMPVSVLAGSFAGGYGAWFAFFVVIRFALLFKS